ncbi:MAG TPA: hypothetical protein VIM11_23680 [Tepidisphaeraceae bacterium]
MPAQSRTVSRLLGSIDDLLRGTGSISGLEDRSPARQLPLLVIILVIFGGAYGAVMGGFGVLEPGHAVQIIFGAIKVPMLLGVSFCLSLPSFMVLNTLMGVRSDAREVLHALLSMQAGLTIVLASLSPFTALWYVSFSDYSVALLFNGVMFAIATLAAQWILRRAYRPLVARNPRHRSLLRIWVVIYSFVAIQMAWVLRPFVGDPASPVTFFRREAWGNAYVEILRIALHATGHGYGGG